MKDRKNLKQVLSILLTVILVFSVLVPAGVVLQNKFSTNKFLDRQNIQEFYSLPKNSIDLLCIGSSQIMNGFVAGEFYKNYGITAYGLGTCSQPVYAAYHWLLEMEKYQSPKMILLEISRLYGNNVHANYVKAFTEMKNTSPIKFKALKGLDLTTEEFISFYSDVYTFHDRFNELTKDDYTYLIGGNRQTYLGAALSERLFDEYELEGEDFSFDEGGSATELSIDQNIEYFEKIVSYCKEKEIELVLFKTTKIDWTAGHHTGVMELARQHGIPFIDLNLSEAVEEIGFDFEKDFIDPEHYNYYGAVKATKYIGEFINENYNLPDRREGKDHNPEFHKKYEEYIHAVKNIELSNSESLDEIFKYLDDDAYTISIAKRGSAELSKQQIDFLKAMGFQSDFENKLNSVFVKHKGKVYVDEASDDKLFFRDMAGTSFYYVAATGGQVTAKSENAAIKIDDQNGISIAVYDNTTKRAVLEYSSITKE